MTFHDRIIFWRSMRKQDLKPQPTKQRKITARKSFNLPSLKGLSLAQLRNLHATLTKETHDD